MAVTRDQHLDLCKQQAIRNLYARRPTRDVWKEFVADLRVHPDTREHPGIRGNMVEGLGDPQPSPARMEEIIESFT